MLSRGLQCDESCLLSPMVNNSQMLKSFTDDDDLPGALGTTEYTFIYIYIYVDI